MSAARRGRRKKPPAARLRRFWFLIAVLLIVASALGGWAATWRGFDPQRVVVSGNAMVPTAEILSRAAIAPDRNLWLQNMTAAAVRVERIPYVGGVRIQRSLPANVDVRVRERQPFARVRFAGAEMIVDRDLRVLERADGERLAVFSEPDRAAPAPGTFLRDDRTKRLRDDCEMLERAHVAAASFRYDRFGGLVVVMPSGVTLLLGDDDDLARKAALIGPVLSQVAARGKRITRLDLRAPNTPVVSFAQTK